MYPGLHSDSDDSQGEESKVKRLRQRMELAQKSERGELELPKKRFI